MIIIASYSNVSVTYTADGTQTVFSFPFDYLRKAFVYVEINDETVLEQGTDFSVYEKTVVFETAPVADTVLKIYRQTDTTPLVSWADASVLKAKDMTVQQTQVLHILEEDQEWIHRNTINRTNNKWNADDSIIENVGNPENPKDAATKDYVDTTYETVTEKLDDLDTAVETATEAKEIALDAADRAEEALELITDNALWFDTVADMKAAEGLQIGMLAGTKGYHSINDGGSSIYNVRAKTESDVEDDGSIIFLNNDAVAELITNNTVSVKQFGGYGDGVTDDTQALQKCIDYAKLKNLAVIIDGKFYITSTIVVPARSRLIGLTSMYTYGAYIIVDPSCSLALDMTRGQVNMRDVTIMAKDNIYAGNTDGVYLLGNSYNADSNFVNVDFNYFRKGAIVSGRNVVFKSCGFSHCQYGIYYDFDDTITQIRGLIVDGCRFHGIGEEADLNWFENSYAVYFNKQKWSQLTVINCTSDQGGCFLYGYGGDFQIENNFIESFKAIPINLGNELAVDTTPGQNGVVLIQGNIFRGKNGSPVTGVTVDYPPNAINVKYLNRVIIQNNTFSKFGEEAIREVSVNTLRVYNNFVQSIGMGGISKALVKAINTSILYLSHNMVDPLENANLVNASGNVGIYADNNSGFLLNNDSTKAPIKRIYEVGTIKGETPVAIELPTEFWLSFTFNGSYILFHCFKHGNYISTDSFRVSRTTTIELWWDHSGSLTPRIYQNNNGTITALASTMTVFVYGI